MNRDFADGNPNRRQAPLRSFSDFGTEVQNGAAQAGLNPDRDSQAMRSALHGDLATFDKSERMHNRFKQTIVRRRAAAFIYIAASLCYLAWRLTVFSPNSLALSGIYFLAECLGFVLGLVIIFCSWRYSHRPVRRAEAGHRVDVFIPTYREPLEIIDRTLRAAIALRYPHRTILLDDGRRPEVAGLAAKLGVTYISRSDNVNAKAGNLNFGLLNSTADFVVVFDADHAPVPEALDILLAPFGDAAVALVQAPQDYFNTDAFPYLNKGKAVWHDQSFFYDIVQAGRDAGNGASCVGTSVAYRRASIDAIGGIPEDTVTEDFHTSLRLHKAGFKVVYINETVAYGVAAVDLGEYYKTRHRWAHGNIHAFRLEGVLFSRRLTVWQKLSYLSLVLIYLEGWQQCILIATPVATLLFGFQPFEITVYNVVIIFLFPIAQLLLLQEIGFGYSRHWTNEIFSMARFPVHIAASAALFGCNLRWRSSSKSIKGSLDWWLLAPQIAVATACILAASLGVARAAANGAETGPLLAAVAALGCRVSQIFSPPECQTIDWNTPMNDGYTFDLVAVAGCWVLYNFLRSMAVISKAMTAASRTHRDFRFEVPILAKYTVAGNPQYLHISRSSTEEAEIPRHATLGSAPRLLPVVLCLPSRCLPVVLDGSGHLKQSGDISIVRYIWASDADREELKKFLYGGPRLRSTRPSAAPFHTACDVIGYAITASRRVFSAPAISRAYQRGHQQQVQDLDGLWQRKIAARPSLGRTTETRSSEWSADK